MNDDVNDAAQSMGAMPSSSWARGAEVSVRRRKLNPSPRPHAHAARAHGTHRFFLSLLVLLLPACQGFQNADREQPSESLPSYRELVERYNANLDRLTKVWASAAMRAEGYEEGGKGFAQGEGELIVVLPDKLALRIGKLGATTLWAGSDGERYWLFELQDEKLARVGRHDGPAAREGLGELPARPNDLLRLWGVQRIDPDRAPPAPAVERVEGLWVIEPPGTQLRIAIDPATGLAQRIDLLDASGKSVVMSRLARHRPVELEGVPPGGWPRVAMVIEVRSPDHPGKITLSLSDPHEQEIKPAVFDFESLVRALKVPPQHVVDLDQMQTMGLGR